MKAFEVTFPVRYYEADPMGVVHHSEYVRYFELARNEWLKSVGYPFERTLAEHLVFPVVHLECDYHRSAMFGDTLTATASIREYSGAAVVFEQTVLDSEGRLCARGAVRIAFMNTALGHVVRCPEALDEIIRETIKNQ